MPFDFTKVLAIFQHLMKNIFVKFLNNFVICYLDDILIFFKNKENCDRHVRLVFEKLQYQALFQVRKMSLSSTLLDFLPILFPKKVFLWIQTKLIQLSIGRKQCLFKIICITLILQIFIESLFKIILRLLFH